MTFSLNKKIKFFLIPFILAVFGIFMPMEIAKAWVLDPVMTALDGLDFVDTHLLILVFELGWWLTISQFFVHFAAELLQWAMHLPIILQGNTLVIHGWNFILGLTNLFFLLFFIAIALCHILKIEIGKFTTTKALTRLIIVALLVNFSLVFVGMFTDIAQIVLSSILASFEAAPLPYGAESLPLAATQMLRDEIGRIVLFFFAPIGVYLAVAGIPIINVAAAIAFIAWIFLTDFFAMGILAIIITILGLLMGLVFLIFALFFIARIVVIWLLAIISPLMMACWIFPSTEKYFRQWFNILIEWLFLGIVGIFVLLLGLANFAYLGDILGERAPGILVNGSQIFPELGFAYLVLILYLFITLHLMKKYLLPSGARDMMGKGEKLLKGTVMPTLQKWGQKGGEKAVGAYKSIGGASRGARFRARHGEGIQRDREKLERTPIIGKMVGGVGAYEKETQEQFEKAEKELENASPKTLQTHLNKSNRTMSKEDRYKHAAALGHLIKRGDISAEDAKKHLRSAKNYGLGSDISKARPDLAFDMMTKEEQEEKIKENKGNKDIAISTAIREATEKPSPGEFVKNVQPKALENIDVMNAITKDEKKIEKIIKEGNMIQRKTLQKTVLGNKKEILDRIDILEEQGKTEESKSLSESLNKIGDSKTI